MVFLKNQRENVNERDAVLSRDDLLPSHGIRTDSFGQSGASRLCLIGVMLTDMPLNVLSCRRMDTTVITGFFWGENASDCVTGKGLYRVRKTLRGLNQKNRDHVPVFSARGGIAIGTVKVVC